MFSVSGWQVTSHKIPSNPNCLVSLRGIICVIMCDYLGGNLDFYTHLFSDGRQLFEKKRLLQRLRVGAVSSFVMLTWETGKRLCRGEIFQETHCRHVSTVFLTDIYSIASNVIQVCIILKFVSTNILL